MRAQTKKQLKRAILYALVLVFALSLPLLYLPIGKPENSPPPLDQVQQQNPPAQAPTAVPGG